MNGRITIEDMALQKLGKLSEPQLPDKIIRFPDVYERICPLFSMNKKTANSILMAMEADGMIEIIRGHGIRLRKVQKCYAINGSR